MSSKIPLPKTLNGILNVAIALVALFLVGVLVKKSFFDRPPHYDYALVTNSKLSIDGIDWTRTDRTILLALGTDCKYCTESAQFYRRLVQGSAGRADIRLIAVFPKKETGAENYLKTLGIPVSEIRYVSLASLGITKVPTLAVLDRNGTVTDLWVAKLPPRVESDIMQRLRLKDSRSKDDWLIDEKILRSRVARGEALTLLDVRDRTAFERGHLDKAINIPLDELQVRAINELAVTDTVVLYGEDDSDTDVAYRILDDGGFTKILFLTKDSSQRHEPSPQTSP